ncbi:hypothetical protein LTR95_008971 [Oleoguttula sp. CCFEE 5521]
MAPPPPRQQTLSKGPMGHYHQQAWLQPSATQPSPTQQPQMRQPPPVQGFPAQQLAQQPPPPVCHTQNQQTSTQQPVRQQPYRQQAVVHQQCSQQVGGQPLVPTHVSSPVPVVAGYQQQVGGYIGRYVQQGMAHAQHAYQSVSSTTSSTTTTTTTTQTTQQQQRQQRQVAGQAQQYQQLQIRQVPLAPQMQHHQQLQIQQASPAPQAQHHQQQVQYVQRAQPAPPPPIHYVTPRPQVQYVAPPPPVQYIAPPQQAPVHHTTNYTTIIQAAPTQPPPQSQVQTSHVSASSVQTVQQQRPRSPPPRVHVNITNVTSSLQTRPKSPPPQVRPPSPPRQLALPSPPRHSSRHDQDTSKSSTTANTTTITNITRTEAESRGADFLQRYDLEMARRLLVVCPPCPAGFRWEAQEDGYECEAGSHLIPYTETDAWIAGRRPHGNLIGKTFTADEVRERYLRRAIRNGMDPRLVGELSRRSEQRSGGRMGRMPTRGRILDDDDDDDMFSAFSAASRRQGLRDPFRPALSPLAQTGLHNPGPRSPPPQTIATSPYFRSATTTNASRLGRDGTPQCPEGDGWLKAPGGAICQRGTHFIAHSEQDADDQGQRERSGPLISHATPAQYQRAHARYGVDFERHNSGAWAGGHLATDPNMRVGEVGGLSRCRDGRHEHDFLVTRRTVLCQICGCELR